MKKELEEMKSASEWQGTDRYPGIDSYEKVELKPGTQVCSLVYGWDNNNPKVCEYLFPNELLDKVDNDSSRLNEGLQIQPFRDSDTRISSYKKEVAVFEVQKSIEVESGKTAENTAYGNGGMTQYYIPAQKFKDCLADGSLKVSSLGNLNKVLELGNNVISESEYIHKNAKLDQLNLRRNLFCHQKAKLDTLEIIQNSPNPEDVKKAEENLKTLDKDIKQIKKDIFESKEKIGKVPSPLYDSLNKQLSSELSYRESHPNNLMLSNVVVKKAETEMTEVVFDRSNMNVVVETGKSKTEEIGENLFKKIDSYKEGSDGNPIDVKRQGLWDVMNINRINRDSKEMMRNEELRPHDYSRLQTLAMQGRDGTFMELNIAEHFTEDSVRKIQNCRNGTLTEALGMKDGIVAKLYVEGNKAQLYMVKDKQFLSNQMDKLGLGDSKRTILQSGGSVSTKQGYVKVDKDLNVLVPSRKQEHQPKQTQHEQHTHSRPKQKNRGVSL